MKCHWLIAVALAVPSAAFAQSQNPFGQRLRTADLQSANASRQTAMYEDIEIMRRILDKALNLPRYSTAGYPGIWSNAFNATPNIVNYYGINPVLQGTANKTGPQTSPYPQFDFHSPVQANSPYNYPYTVYPTNPNQFQYQMPNSQAHSCLLLPGVQGVYLPGYGVIFTATLPPGPVTTTPATAAEPAKPVSEWDRVRRQVRGEKPKSVQPKKAPQPPTVADVILKVLAENGHHFRQLKDNEKITVVVTLEPMAKTDTLQPWMNLYYAQPQPNAQPSKQSNPPKSKPRADVEFVSPSANASAGKSVNEYELLARLQLEQGHEKEAIHALTKAAEATKDSRHAAELYLKIAGLCLSAGHDEQQARAMASKAAAMLLQVAAAAPRAKNTAPQPATPKTHKLIITATRKQLVDVATGRNDFETFKGQAGVRTVELPAAGSSR